MMNCLITLLALSIWTPAASKDDPTLFTENRWCTPDDLLPLHVPDESLVSPEWSTESLIVPPYGCDCSFFRARYFCPDLGDEGYPAWVPRSVSQGSCKDIPRPDLQKDPLPPNSRVLFYGNSHLRQVIEGMMCMFKDKVETKYVRYYGEGTADRADNEREVSGDSVCRGCVPSDRDVLLDHGCMSEDVSKEGCLCTDNHAEFNFENGATLHYFMAATEENKSLSDSLPPHGNVSWSWYDAVFANQGNHPPLSPKAVVKASSELKEASVPFFWLNTYEGGGDPSKWEYRHMSSFQDSGARSVKIDSMTHGMTALTKGEVEDTDDPHFCLPGPPDEMSLLLVKIMWAVYFEDHA